MDTPDLSTIEKAMIADDASFMVGLSLATRQLSNGAGIPYLYSSIDFYSLIVYEAYNYYSKHDPALAASLKHKYEDDIKQSRQRMKLYDDKKLGIEGIGKTLLDTVTPAHQKQLSKTHRIKLPKWAWKDIGIYYVEGNPIAISSTHLASFNMGIDVTRMFDSTTANEFGEELGHFLIAMAKTITLVRLPKLNIIAQDMHSEKLYTQSRYGSPSRSINAGLSIIDMNMNFAALCLPPSARHSSLLKWKFLSTYHAVSSLRMLKNSIHAKDIDASTMQDIEKILNCNFAQLLNSEGANIFRNTITHYGIDTRINAYMLSMNQLKLSGLVEASMPGWTYESLANELDAFIQDKMLNIFRSW